MLKSENLQTNLLSWHKHVFAFFRWAETMGPEDSHDEQSVRGRCFYEYGEKLGQNCAFRTDSSKTRTQLIRGGIKAWFDEVGG